MGVTLDHRVTTGSGLPLPCCKSPVMDQRGLRQLPSPWSTPTQCGNREGDQTIPRASTPLFKARLGMKAEAPHVLRTCNILHLCRSRNSERAEITAEHQPHSQLCHIVPHQISRINSWGVDVTQAGSCVTAAGISVPALTAAGNVAFAAIILLHPALSCPQRGDLLPAKALGARNNTCPRWTCSTKPIGEC